ncbi:hypothetical protein CV093_04035 [Oceanobacillus sp. 143]|nr:hypothetical protein CV093_04035 [Oceanobacillus sp. 143]
MEIELNEIEKEFSNYIQRLENNFDDLLSNKAEEYDQPLYLLKTYYFYMSFIADKKLLNKRHHTDKILCAKTSTDIFGIYNCLKSGLFIKHLLYLEGL